MLGCPPHVPPALARRSLLIWVFFTLLVPARAELATPEDQQLSPYTGYTRQHWLEITEKLIAGVLPYFDSETGMPDLTGVNEESGHFRQLETDEWPKETFERSLMLVAIYTAATGSDRIDGYRGSIVEPFLRGIARGTDPKDAAYWGPHPEFEIYGTNTAMAILLSPGFFWRPLTPEQQDNVLELMKGLVATVAYDCNHWYFHLMGVPVLEKYGETPDRSAANLIFERLLNWHRGDGWFIDGGNRAFDYYNLWGFQLITTHFVILTRSGRRCLGTESGEQLSSSKRHFLIFSGEMEAQFPGGDLLLIASPVLQPWAILFSITRVRSPQAKLAGVRPAV